MKHPECPSCGSDQILCDAFAYWNHAQQEWELYSIYDGNVYCNDCGAEFSDMNWGEDCNEV